MIKYLRLLLAIFPAFQEANRVRLQGRICEISIGQLFDFSNSASRVHVIMRRARENKEKPPRTKSAAAFGLRAQRRSTHLVIVMGG
jgi:hypothetical protein